VKKKASDLKKLSLRRETVNALEKGRLQEVLGEAHYSIPAFFTCPECAPQ
jgi:DNA-binding XRE family transcriptional regulator